MPVDMAGKAIEAHVVLAASARRIAVAARKQLVFLLLPACQTGPTVWMTWRAGSRYPW